MKKALTIWMFANAGLLSLWGQTPIASVRQVTELSNAQAAQHLPVQLQATVTFVAPQDGSLFLQDRDAGVYVNFSQDVGIVPGDRVAVTGVTSASFRPEINAREVHVLSHGEMPKAPVAKFEDLIAARWDSRYVQVYGHVLSAAYEQTEAHPTLRLRVKMSDGIMEANLSNPGPLQPEALLEADVRLTGVAGGDFDSRMEMAGVWMDINSSQEVEILHPAAKDPWAMPVVATNQVVSNYRASNASHRVHVAGTLTYFEPGAVAVVERDNNAILVETRSSLPLHAGAGVEATGFPEISEENVRLEDGQLRPAQQAKQVQPKDIAWDDAASGTYAYRLVAMEGEVVAEVHDSRVDLLVISAGGHLFSASMRQDSSDANRSPSGGPAVQQGSRVRVVGVCFVDPGNHWRDRLWFDVRMRSLGDVVVLQNPSWWTVKRLAYLATILSLAIVCAVTWVWLLQRRVLRQTALIARKNQEESERERVQARRELQRGHILEMISKLEPLPNVLKEITSLISSRLDGAPARFELFDKPVAPGETERRQHGPGLQTEVVSRDGRLLGVLLATPKPHAASGADISAAMQVGAQLAGLAIDTRGLYSELRHRSEHDLLTEIPNRFSMERELDALMEEAENEGRSFGLIYVDLDKFKEVNDRYGHRTGDLYLQAVSGRMQAQLREGDFLARIGGDEFIALIPNLQDRADAEEIAQRLERCFEEPFSVENLRLLGSASIGLAVYPEDGASKEELQRSADAAMYAHKESKKYRELLVDAMRGVTD